MENNNNETEHSAKKTNKRVENKRKRMNGKAYEGFSMGKVCERNPRDLKVGCSSTYCDKSKVRHCNLFSEDMRKEIFDRFWKMSWEQKKCMQVILLNASIENVFT